MLTLCPVLQTQVPWNDQGTGRVAVGGGTRIFGPAEFCHCVEWNVSPMCSVCTLMDVGVTHTSVSKGPSKSMSVDIVSGDQDCDCGERMAF